MWFIALLVTPHPDPKLSLALAADSYPTHQACMEAGAYRAGILVGVGVHGRYLCMKHGESDAALAKTAKREF